MANTILVGAQWGDEGKGKVIDVLTEQADVVVFGSNFLSMPWYVKYFEGRYDPPVTMRLLNETPVGAGKARPRLEIPRHGYALRLCHTGRLERK